MPADPYPELYLFLTGYGTNATSTIDLIPGRLLLPVMSLLGGSGLVIAPNAFVQENLVSDRSRYSRPTTPKRRQPGQG